MSQAQYTSDIVRLIEQQGNQAAAAADRRGQIWGGALANLGQIPLQVQQQQIAKQHQQLQAQELGLRTQQLGMEVDRATQEKQDRQDFDKILSDPKIYNPDHTINREFLAKAPIPGHLRPKFDDLAAHLDETQTAIQKKKQDLADSQNEAVGRAMLKVESAGNDPNALGMALTSLVASGAMSPSDAKVYQARATTPEAVASITKRLKAGTKAGESDLMIVPEGATPLDKRTNQPLAGFTPTEKPKDEFNTFKEIYAKTAGKTSWNQLSPTEQAAGFKAFVEAKADPAAERQAKTIAQQTATQAAIAGRQLAQEGRRQDFAEATAGRSVLTKAEQQYQTALASAQTLRDTVAAAKAGNKVAASLQSLETTFSAVRAQGLNRVNTTELNLPAGAGNSWDRLQGWFGKATEGQPVPPDIQKDMLGFADVLEKGAYKKYTDTHKSVTTRYRLKNEPPLPAPDSAAPPSPVPSGGGATGLTYADYLRKKGG